VVGGRELRRSGMELEPDPVVVLGSGRARSSDGRSPKVEMLSEKDRRLIERRLEQERARALDALGEFDRSRESSMLEETGELTMYRLHPADIGTEAMELEKQFLLASNEGRRLYAIDEALRRLYAEPERFGRCERCGQEIGVERLDVLPYASFCADCQILTEQQAEGG
jgi:DnaK suppressor protein